MDASQFYRLAVGRAAIGFGPGFFASKKGRRIAQARLSHEPLQGSQPVMIIARAVIGLAPARSGLDFISESGRPLFPGEMSLFGKFDCERKGLGLPRLGEHRPTLVARKAWERRQLLGL